MQLSRRNFLTGSAVALGRRRRGERPRHRDHPRGADHGVARYAAACCRRPRAKPTNRW